MVLITDGTTINQLYHTSLQYYKSADLHKQMI